MATGWMKSLQCKSKASDDVVHHIHHRQNHHHQRHRSLSHSSSCKNSLQSLKDIVETNKKQSKPTQPAPFKRPRSRKTESSSPNRPPPTTRTWSSSSETFFPSLNELPEGHPSRNVVEIIFHTSWGDKAFPGRVEMMFKIQNPTRTVARFEEYRETVRSWARSNDVAEGVEDHHARCVADGNEVMRFYCLGATSGGSACDIGVGTWGLNSGGKGASTVCTYSGSGVAHESGGGGGSGRRAMLVCRVVAGRVCEQLDFDSFVDSRVGYDSVSGEDGKLLVFDSSALLPCFLIIYKL